LICIGAVCKPPAELAANDALSLFVIPAPLVSEASKRDQAGTQTRGSMVTGRNVSTTAPRLP